MWESNKLGGTSIVGAPKPKESSQLILDGQQRVTSIYYAVRAPREPLLEQKEEYKFFVQIKILLNQSKYPTSPIVKGYTQDRVKAKGLDDPWTQYEKQVFPLYAILDAADWCKNLSIHLTKGKKGDNDNAVGYAMEIQNRLSSILNNYKIPIIKLPKNLKIGEVADVFERINTTGKPLSNFDLLNARFARHGVRLHYLWDGIKKKHSRIREWCEISKEEDVALSTFKALAFSKSNPIGKADLLKLDRKYAHSGTFEQEGFERDWKEMSSYVNNAMSG